MQCTKAAGCNSALAIACLQRDTLDLSHGQREFLTRELAEDALEPLLADGAVTSRVTLSLLQLTIQRPQVLACVATPADPTDQA